jgi:DNA-binding transcriptional LysR family regulator
VLRLVECGLGMAILPTGASRLTSRAVVFRKVPWLQQTTSLRLVSRSGARPPLVDRFAAMVARARLA